MKRAISVPCWALLLLLIAGSAYAQPAKIVLESPSDNATSVAVTPTFKWFGDPQADTYTIEIADGVSFGNILDSQSLISDTTYSPASPLDNGTQYFWRVRGTGGGSDGPDSNKWSFTTIVAAPGAPSLSSPSDNATDVELTPTFTWSAGSGSTDSYRIDVSTASDFASLAVSDSGNVSTSFTPGGPLLTETEYFWRVRGKNVGGSSDWSSTFSFTTVPPPPAVPTLTSPADAATGVSVDPTLEWGAVSGADTYTVQLDTDPAFGSPDQSQTQASTSFSPTTLSEGTTYYWRVKANGPGGDSGYSSRSFTTLFNPPGAPTLTSPADNATDVSLTPTLVWSAGSGTSDTYRIDVSTASDFSSFVISDSSSSTTSFAVVSALSTSTEYFWRVRGKNPGGPGAWSSTFSFTTVPPPPVAPTLTSPADNAVDVSTDPTLEWASVSGADTYTVELDTDGAFGSPDQSQTLASTTFSPTTLSKGTVYYWRVKANGPGGESDYSSRSFTTLYDPPGAPTLSIACQQRRRCLTNTDVHVECWERDERYLSHRCLDRVGFFLVCHE